MNVLEKYEKTFNECCKVISKAIKQAIEKTEKQTKRKLTKKEKELCIKIGVCYLFYRSLEKNIENKQ